MTESVLLVLPEANRRNEALLQRWKHLRCLLFSQEYRVGFFERKSTTTPQELLEHCGCIAAQRAQGVFEKEPPVAGKPADLVIFIGFSATYWQLIYKTAIAGAKVMVSTNIVYAPEEGYSVQNPLLGGRSLPDRFGVLAPRLHAPKEFPVQSVVETHMLGQVRTRLLFTPS